MTFVFMTEAPMSMRATASPPVSPAFSSYWFSIANPSRSTMTGLTPASSATAKYSVTFDFFTATRIRSMLLEVSPTTW